MAEPIVRLENIVKEFPGVKALDDVSFDLLSGEVHALVGENGAGKSTLIKTLLGAYIPTSGNIYVDGNIAKFSSPFDASKLGIEGVHQELMLIPWLSVTQNIFINRELRDKFNFFDLKTMNDVSKKLLASFGVDIDVTKPVKYYSPSIWKMIDIARVININPKVIVFDEPTAILTETEIEKLFKKIDSLKTSGIGIVYISHRMNELRSISDRITIMRDGKKISTSNIKDLTDGDIVKQMIGRDIQQYYKRDIVQQGENLVNFKNVFLKKGQKDITLNVNRGEIVGFSGLVGSGRTEIAESLIGINRVLQGEIFYKNKLLVSPTPRAMIDKKIYLVPENRKYQGLILSFSVGLNICLSIFRKWNKIFYSRKKEQEFSSQIIKKLRIKTPSEKTIVKSLSGGNQQKVVIGKSLLAETDFLIFDEPTVGVDVGAKEEIYNLMNSFVNNNGGILMISSDLPEIIGMCDRVYVMYEGEIVKEFSRSEISEEKIAPYMLAGKRDLKDIV